MVNKINDQKMATRGALAYVASKSRDQSPFAIPSSTESKVEDKSQVLRNQSLNAEKSQ